IYPVVMSNGVSTSADKNIVDLSRGHGDKAVSKAVRVMRERLQFSGNGIRGFDRDLLALHAAAVLQGASIIPMFIILVTGIGLYINPAPNLFGWALLALSVHAINILIARRASRVELTAADTRKWRLRLLAGQVLIGISWALFSLQDCTTCS